MARYGALGNNCRAQPDSGLEAAARMGRGRKPEFPDKLPITGFPEGTLARLVPVLRPGEGRPDFIRHVILNEIERREAGAKPARGRNSGGNR